MKVVYIDFKMRCEDEINDDDLIRSFLKWASEQQTAIVFEVETSVTTGLGPKKEDPS